jgi:hypothetical protein
MWKTCTRERWDVDQLFDSCHEQWPHVLSWRTCMCRVVRFSLVRCILIRIFVTLLDMGDGLITVFKCSNATLFCFVNYEDDIDYFIVEA